MALIVVLMRHAQRRLNRLWVFRMYTLFFFINCGDYPRHRRFLTIFRLLSGISYRFKTVNTRDALFMLTPKPWLIELGSANHLLSDCCEWLDTLFKPRIDYLILFAIKGLFCGILHLTVILTNTFNMKL